jgi:magnesium transporter
MLASFWGMNVVVPFSHAQYGFAYIVAVSAIVTALVIFFFRKKKMF